MAGDSRGFYENFNSPVALLRRMLATRDAAAYRALGRAATKIVAGPLDRAWASAERRRLADASDLDRGQIFVIGGARCGTTFTAQLLAAGLQVGWLDNVAELFPRSPLTAMVRLRRTHWDGPISFHSFYGNTRRLGDPNDAFFLWNRWLGNDRYTATVPSDPATRTEMRQFFAAFGDAFETVLLNKNNRNLVVAGDLADVLPGAHFVGVRRDPMDTVRSLLTARKMTHGDVTEPWGVLAESSRARSHPLGYIDDICHQVAAFERTHHALATRLGDRYTGVALEATLEDPETMLKEISVRTGVGLRDELPAPTKRSPSTTSGLEGAERARAAELLEELGVV